MEAKQILQKIKRLNPLIRVVIQRHVIEQILEYVKEYFYDSTQPKFMGGMESFMYRRDNELIDVAEAFARKRDGIDGTTKVFPIKLRQLIFAALLKIEGLTILILIITKTFFMNLLKISKHFKQ